MKFRVLAGQHCEKDRTGVARVWGKGEVVDSKSDLNRLNTPAGNKFEQVADDTKCDPGTPLSVLSAGVSPEEHKKNIAKEEKRHREVEQARQQEQGSSPPPKSHTPPTSVATMPPPQNVKEYCAQLDRMTLKELTDHAAEEEIDLKGAKTKDEVLKILKVTATAGGQ